MMHIYDLDRVSFPAGTGRAVAPQWSRLPGLKQGSRASLAAGISAAVFALALAVPQRAAAAEECGPTDNGFVQCDPSDSNYADGIRYERPYDGTPGDLIVIVAPGSEISTSASRGIDVVNFGGVAIVGAEGVNISTTGDYANGIWALSNTESALVSVGNVHTSGFGAGGIVAVGTQNAQVLADTVRTEGDEATGIEVIAEISAARVRVNHVETAGDGASGIIAMTETIDPDFPFASGVIDIEAGSVKTSGDGSYGIAFNTGDPRARSTILVGEVVTSGDDALGIYGTGAGASSITAGKITTSGANSIGIVSDKEFGDEVIEAGTIETSGAGAHGIVAFNSFGAIETRVNSITTQGDDSHGIFQENFNGSVATDAGHIVTRGTGSNGLTSASLFGRVRARIANVETYGASSYGVFAAGGTSVDASVGAVVTRGDDSVGVRFISGSAGRDVPLIRGAIVADVASVETFGDNAVGVSATALGTIDLTVGSVHTRGAGAIGVNSLLQDVGTHNVTIGEIITEGDSAEGALIAHNSLTPHSTMTIDIGSVQTFGNLSSAVRVEQELSEASLTLRGNLVTTGEFSHGVWLSHARGGSLAVASASEISTQGFGANGINLDTRGAVATIDVNKIATAGDNASAIRITAVDEHIIDEQSSNITIRAQSLATSGAESHGIDILLEGPGGGGIGIGNLAADMSAAPAVSLASARTDIDIRTGNIAVTGDGSDGIRIDTIGAVRLETGATEARGGEALAVTARDTVDLRIGGRTAAGGAAAVRLTGADVSVALGASGSVIAAGDALLLSANGAFLPDEEDDGGIFFPFAYAGGGTVMVTNAGTVRSETGFALRVDTGATTVANSGLMSGSIALSDGNDSVANAGTFELGGASDFGSGIDRFVNSGTVRLRDAAVNLAGLDSFENRGGHIDLGNGRGGDILSLPGTYVGSDGARITLDVGSAASDQLVVGGAATGSTAIVIQQVPGTSASLFSGRKALVTAGAGSAADAFSLAAPVSGFIAYDLAFDAGTNSFGVTAKAGASVHRLAKIQEGVQALALKTGETWTAHMADLRASQDGGRLWGQMFGGNERRDGGDADFDLRARQNFFGAQLGYDVIRGQGDGAWHLGVTAGYASGRQRFSGGGERVRFDAANLGVYAGVRSGPLFVNGLAHYERQWLDVSDSALGWDDQLHGTSIGVAAEAGLRLESRGFYAEPVAMLNWTRSKTDSLEALGQRIEFDDADGLRGKIGLRFGGTISAGQTPIDLFGGANYAHEFAGEDGVILRSGGLSETIGNRRLADYGELLGGLRVRASANVSGFIQGSYSFGGAVNGGGGRIGLQIKL